MLSMCGVCCLLHSSGQCPTTFPPLPLSGSATDTSTKSWEAGGQGIYVYQVVRLTRNQRISALYLGVWEKTGCARKYTRFFQKTGKKKEKKQRGNTKIFA